MENIECIYCHENISEMEEFKELSLGFVHLDCFNE